ncbi:Mpo1 family 2-hydroxy fatty acid dioxygenase [Arenibaculum pallidiluteum]|uniref:Mpo1 family 2-hydroxy fatty acid dioxygenase n=1 Tax=Arenibaculum pallidiluteum TaxID=2812559 RepID=UPI001A966665|nr:Mpo1-like protein [Arenibaculum pallidiluteum]
MRTFSDHLAHYAACHRDPRNRMTHYVGVPAIIFAAMVLLSLAPLRGLGADATLAQVVTVAALAYYLLQDLALGLALTVVFGLLLWAAGAVAALGTGIAVAVFAVAFVGGWAVQLLGHHYEGNRPALLTSLFQILVSPVFLMAEVFFALGLKGDLARDIAARNAGRRG